MSAIDIDHEVHATAVVEMAFAQEEDEQDLDGDGLTDGAPGRWRNGNLRVAEALLVWRASSDTTGTRLLAAADFYRGFDQAGAGALIMKDLFVEQRISERFRGRAGIWRPEFGIVEVARPYFNGIYRGVGYWQVNPVRLNDQAQLGLWGDFGVVGVHAAAVRVWDGEAAEATENVDLLGRVDLRVADGLGVALSGLLDFNPLDRDLVREDETVLDRGDPGAESRTAVAASARWDRERWRAEGQVIASIGGATMSRAGEVVAIEPGRRIDVYVGGAVPAGRVTAAAYLEWNGPTVIAIPKVSATITDQLTVSALYAAQVDRDGAFVTYDRADVPRDAPNDGASLSAMYRF